MGKRKRETAKMKASRCLLCHSAKHESLLSSLPAPLPPLLSLLALSLFCAAALAADWPTWRYDVTRSAATPEQLPAELHPQWVRDFPKPRRAWLPKPDDRLRFDVSYEPVVMGKTLFVPSNVSDSVAAYDTDTGAEKWRFFADGPVRFAPVAWKNRLYFVSDDSFLYCLDAATGRFIWKYRGAPADKRVLGNERLISMWPGRGAPVLVEGKIYFAASIWPFMGIFIHAVDAGTGKAVWTNSGTGATWMIQPHHNWAFACVAPQGYFVAVGDRLLVPGGRSVPACFNRKTGKLLYYHLDKRFKTRAGTIKIGSYHVSARGKWFFNHNVRDNRTWMFALEDGMQLLRFGSKPVLTGNAIYSLAGAALVAHGLRPEIKKTMDKQGKLQQIRASLREQWRIAVPGVREVYLKAGSRLYLGGPGLVIAADIGTASKRAKVGWTTTIEGMPWSMLAADGKLFVVTEEGRVYCFGAEKRKAKTWALSRNRMAEPNDQMAMVAKAVLKETNIREGYCLVLGAGRGRLAEELARQSKLHIIVIDPDAEKIGSLRRRWHANGLYGVRIAAHAGDPLTFPLPPYLASLVVCGDVKAAGLDRPQALSRQLAHILRPYGGIACLPLSADVRAATADAVKQVLPNAKLESSVLGWTLVTRSGALPGSADWTHQYADPANSVVSRDEHVKLPLGLLWFGGPSNDGVLPRHGHGPSPQVAHGRLIIEGPDLLRCLDVYTGRLVWERKFPGIGKPYNNTSHQPGANAVGANYVTLPDAVYVNWNRKLLRLDPATGQTVAEFSVAVGSKQPPELGYIAVSDDVLVVGVSPIDFEWSPDFTTDDLNRLNRDRLAALVQHMKTWKGLQLTPKAEGEDDRDYVVKHLNKLIRQKTVCNILTEEIPKPIRARPRRRKQYQRYVNRYLKKQGGKLRPDDKQLRVHNRRLLTTYYRVPRAAPTGRGKGLEGSASRRLTALNRHTGKVLWTVDAARSFRHNAIAIGGGKLFCVDRLPARVVSLMRRRGERARGKEELIALDLRTGKAVWRTDKDVFGTWLGYSGKHDALLQAGSSASDRLFDEESRRMGLRRAADGRFIWKKNLRHAGPCLLFDAVIFAQTSAYHILTGERATRKHPLTDATLPLNFRRLKGCNTVIGSRKLITFRSTAAAFFDLENDGGTGNFGGFKSGCTSNLIAANGVLSAPDYTRTCTCSYQNQCSLALVHMPDVEVWAFNYMKWDKKPVRRVGINFGAPGDRRAQNGTLWLDCPSVGGPSPDLPVTIVPKKPECFRKHSTAVKGPPARNACPPKPRRRRGLWPGGKRLKWVAASGAKGIRRFELTLGPAGRKRRYTIRLHFLEPENLKPGDRVFSVALQGKTVLRDFDVASQAGGADRPVIREFKGIEVADVLNLAFTPSARSQNRPAVISGLEAIMEEGRLARGQ